MNIVVFLENALFFTDRLTCILIVKRFQLVQRLHVLRRNDYIRIFGRCERKLGLGFIGNAYNKTAREEQMKCNERKDVVDND